MIVYAVTVNDKAVKVFLHKAKALKHKFKLFQNENDGQTCPDFGIKTFTVDMEH